MKRYILIGLLIVSPICALAAEELPVHPHTINKDENPKNGVGVNIKAEKLKYIQDTGIMIASGSVEVEMEGLHIFADSLMMNTYTNVVTAEGNITMYGGPLDYHATSSFITYNVSNETTSFDNFKTKTSPSTINGAIYLRAQQIEDKKSHMIGREGFLTTCDYAEHGKPHYITSAKKIEYYPNDKIVGWWVTAYEQWIGKCPIMWSPYMVYDLKKRNKKNWVIGQNQVEGWFLKTAWDNPAGLFYLDYIEKKGIGLGALAEKGEDSAYLYWIYEKDTGLNDSVIKLNKKYDITDESTLDLSYNASNIYLIPSGRMNQSEIKANFNHTSDKRLSSNLSFYESRISNTEKFAYGLQYTKDRNNTSYSATLDQGKGATHYITIAQRLNHSQPFFRDSASFKTNISYFNRIASTGQYGDEILQPEVEIVDNYDHFTLRYYENWNLDLDQGLNTSDNADQFREIQPEITLSLKPLDLKLFNLSSSLSYGWYREVKYIPSWGYNRDFATSRYQSSLSANKSLPLALGSTLTLGAGITQNLYQPGDALYLFTEDARIETRLLDHIKNKVTYTRGITEGNSPFYFDKVGTRYNNYKEQFTLYHQDKFSWQTEGGYNWETNQHLNINSKIHLKPSNALNLNFRSGFDIENEKYLDLQSDASFTPLPWLMTTLSMINDLNEGRLKSATSLVDLEIGSEEKWQNHWRFKFSHSYNTATRQYQFRDIMVVKDLHCWEVKYTYSDYRKEFSLIFTLKAMPNEPIGYATGRGFYYEGFDKALDKEIKGDSPKRY